jgi:hypothetical protein
LGSAFPAHSRCNLNNNYSGHIFAGHQLRPVHRGADLNNVVPETWPSVLLIILLCILAFVKSRGINRVLRIIQSTFSKQILQQLEREQGSFVKTSSIALNVFFALNLAFLVYKLNRFFPYVLIQNAPISQFFFFLFLIVLLMGLKVVFNWLIGLFSNQEKLLSEYDTSSGLLNQTFGLFIFPWLILSEFTDFLPVFFLSVACLVLSFSIILKWYRGMLMGLVEERIGILQIFSYFCGLEILPLFVVIKFVIETF